MTDVLRHRTAIRRSSFSKPIRLAVEDGIIHSGRTVFDYGCGRGDDLIHLRAAGIPAEGWDPATLPSGIRAPADVVNLGYVVNVIEQNEERTTVLQNAWTLARQVLIVSARLSFETSNHLTSFGDGVLTARQTFQKYYQQEELHDWIAAVLGNDPVPASPGTFYVFRDSGDREAFVASRFSRRIATPRMRASDRLYQQHQALFDALAEFLTSHGRLPADEECQAAGALRHEVGSVRRAYATLVHVFGMGHWDEVRASRTQDLLVYLALGRFRRRPRPSDLPGNLLLDVKAFFGTYSTACVRADELLFSAGRLESIEQALAVATFGKITPSALYVHREGLNRLPATLRVYAGCAEVLVGTVEGANIIKLHRREPRISYLCYPDFETDPHPALLGGLIVDLRSRSVHYRDYSESDNPPILHRKETFVLPEHPLRTRFERLTRQEEKHGLLEDNKSIGFRSNWQELLASKGLVTRGHMLQRKGPPSGSRTAGRRPQTAADEP